MSTTPATSPGDSQATTPGSPPGPTPDAARGRPPSPRVAARREATRAQILEAAWQLSAELGLTGFSLRELAGRVGMRAPSLYEYFAGKHDIYDAMFAAANRDFLAGQLAAIPPLDEAGARGVLLAGARFFLDFASDDPVRFQLLFQRSIAGWEPSPAAYAPAVEAYDHMRARFAELGIVEQRDLDLWTAMTSGLAHQQLANDPGGRRWHDLVDATVDLFLHHLDLPEPGTTDPRKDAP